MRSPRLAVSAAFFLSGALVGVWASRIPAVAGALDLSKTTLGLLLLCIAAGAIISFPLAGWGSDKFGAARLTRILAAFYCATLLVVAIAPNVWVLAVALLFFGAGHGALDVAMNTWAAAVERKMGKAIMSSFHAIFSLGAGVGAAAGYGAVAFDLSVPVHFLLAVILLGGPVGWLVMVPWQDLPPGAQKKAPLFALPKGPLVAVGIMALCASMGEGAMTDWSAIFLIAVGGVTEAKAALGYAVFSAAMVAMRLMGDRLVGRFGMVGVARASGAVAFIGTLVAVFVPGFIPTLVGFALMGLGYATIFPLAFSRAANDPHIGPGAGIASVATLGYGGILLGPPIIGFIADATSLSTAFLVLSVLALAIVLLGGALRR
ncbi:MFS transporter [Abyssibius alkaniclasticus]|uniref:MFS transporter n=1 Tax=Abyssibius alkaniclasticus TaxID=2881234 RepID=UPI002363B206|nr:MFS transporter [Abyssibius alkaniclasticus]UPH72027.1 MFS transporter [Abyssibius alkaniclasticus]|tara:strand:- start:3899 stop:5023 length:1125 start_codon:yes stop_codon:yes gene_type:complete